MKLTIPFIFVLTALERANEWIEKNPRPRRHACVHTNYNVIAVLLTLM